MVVSRFRGIEESNDDLQEMVTTMIQTMGQAVDAVTMVKVQRLRSKVNDRPGLVKIAFSSREDKITVLRNKSKLADMGQ